MMDAAKLAEELRAEQENAQVTCTVKKVKNTLRLGCTVKCKISSALLQFKNGL